MAVEKFIHDREPFHKGHHDGRHSELIRIAEAEHQLYEWEFIQADEVIFQRKYGEVINDQFTPYDFEQLEEVRQELRGMCE